MSSEPVAASFVETSKVVLDITKKMGSNHALLAGLFCALALVAVLPVELTSELPVWLIQTAPILAVSMGIYFLAVCYLGRQKMNHAIELLKHLGRDEKSLLGVYLKSNITCMRLDIFNPTAMSLIAKGVLFIPSACFNVLNTPIALQPYAQIHLRKHPELLDMKEADIGSDESIDPLINNPGLI